MGLLYIHWQRDHIYYKPVQKEKSKDRTANKQHHPETINAEATNS